MADFPSAISFQMLEDMSGLQPEFVFPGEQIRHFTEAGIPHIR